ncbi:hypothetical protein Desaci_3424 [Desulfosporosinus acidiphilus SJ4]|uniref:Cyclic lactone autoinducer peptide n=1 Tax=Desulfosporosinus acidiphilus (strain DSM 22704 / JCM 16185 / SJ4) TaxID=646529 RepID=I4D940_DESAJ|nr:cyclic lactone autoinducer peptide [Desulfosporosinus acidiphilus]AFM42314.1 hypothetical protein Desaci_3424 [Desulfosporosinus acidiphilus SJ4]
MKRVIFTFIAAGLLLLANVTSVFACGWLGYQPTAPKSLQK